MDAALADFDQTMEQLLTRIFVFSEASEILETYEYAKLGQAAGLVILSIPIR